MWNGLVAGSVQHKAGWGKALVVMGIPGGSPGITGAPSGSSGHQGPMDPQIFSGGSSGCPKGPGIHKGDHFQGTVKIYFAG